MYNDGTVEGSIWTVECRSTYCRKFPQNCEGGEEAGFVAEKCLLPVDHEEHMCGVLCPPGACEQQTDGTWVCSNDATQEQLKELFEITDLEEDVPPEFYNEQHLLNVDCLNIEIKSAPDTNRDGVRGTDIVSAVVSGTFLKGGQFENNQSRGMVQTFAVRVGEGLSDAVGGDFATGIPCHYLTTVECGCVADYVSEGPWVQDAQGECSLTEQMGYVECPFICQDQEPCIQDLPRLCELLTTEYFEGRNSLGGGKNKHERGLDLYGNGVGKYETYYIVIEHENQVYEKVYPGHTPPVWP